MTARPRPVRRRLLLLGAVLLSAAVTSGCGLPSFGFPEPVTEQARRVDDLWKGSALAALIVGVFVWGLIFWAVIVYRKRTDELPRQVRYNLPIEVLYTVVPFVIIAGLFFFTARDEIYINKLTANPDVEVNIIGYRWNWQFEYLNVDPADPSTAIQVTGGPNAGPNAKVAEMVLPVGRTIRFYESSADVIHSFWVPAFLFKRDVIPGRVNQFEITIEKQGTFVGRCAELCGADHDRMNFSVRAVSPQEYEAWKATQLAAVRQIQDQNRTGVGNTGTPGDSGPIVDGVPGTPRGPAAPGSDGGEQAADVSGTASGPATPGSATPEQIAAAAKNAAEARATQSG